MPGGMPASHWALAGALRWIGAHAEQLLETDAGGRPAWRRHGIAPLLLETVRNAGSTPVSADFTAALDARCREIAHDNLRRMGALRELLAACASADVAVLTFKGPTLGVLAYGDLARRDFADLDVLVSAHDTAAAWSCLRALGYLPYPSLTVAQRGIHARTAHQQTFVHPATRVVVEVHWALLPRVFASLMDERIVWARVRRIDVGGAPVSTLGADDLILFLAVHGAKHAWWRLAWIADFAHLIVREPAADWGALLAAARKRGADRILLLALTLATDFAPECLPGAVPRVWLASRELRRLADAVQRRWLWQPPDPAHPENRPFQLAVLPRLRDRVRYVTTWVSNPTTLDFAALDLPPRARGLYYAMRPLRFIRDGCRRQH